MYSDNLGERILRDHGSVQNNRTGRKNVTWVISELGEEMEGVGWVANKSINDKVQISYRPAWLSFSKSSFVCAFQYPIREEPRTPEFQASDPAHRHHRHDS